MSEEYEIHWLESVIKQIEARNSKIVVISAGKTPSGHVHIGFLRELIIGDSIRRILIGNGKEVIFRVFFDSLDAAKRFPPYIDKSYGKKYLGKPISLIPPPFHDITAESYGEYFGKELLEALPHFGIDIEPIWTHKLYKKEEMINQIRIGLQKNEKVKKILLEHITFKMNDEDKAARYDFYKDWMPVMVICENCSCTQKKMEDGTIKPNRVIKFDEKQDTVTYHCPACNHKAEVSVSSGLLKLNWRLDWPAKWELEPKNTFECSGKDHFTPVTGSWAVSTDLCKEIYGYEGPVGLGYEWVRLGDNDMGTSRGVVYMPKTYLTMIEPELIRLLVLKTNPSRHISFRVEEISLLYDEFEKIERIYYGLEEVENENAKKEIRFLYPLIISKEVSEKCPVQIPFKFLIMMAQLQNLLSIETIIEKVKMILEGRGISSEITQVFMKKRLDQTINWLTHLKKMISNEKDGKRQKSLRNKADFFTVPDSITDEIKNQLNENQKESLKLLSEFLENTETLTEENLKNEMMKIQKNSDIKAKELFQAIYLILIGTKKGPRLGPFMTLLDLKWLKKRFSAV